jgi:hypothetical protein
MTFMSKENWEAQKALNKIPKMKKQTNSQTQGINSLEPSVRKKSDTITQNLNNGRLK